MKKVTLILVYTLIAVLGVAPVCLAWGPGVHMAIGNAVLNNLELLPLAVARLLLSDPAVFLYGCLSADIFIGKGSRAKPLHSHNWKTGLALLHDAADNPYLKTYALGYLSHLAADITAHNYYVPNLMGRCLRAGRLGHVYIEMLADSRVNRPANQAAALFCQANREADRSLCKQMKAGKPGFLFKKKLFHGTIELLEYQSFVRSLEFSRKIVPAYHREYLGAQLNYSYGLVIDLLQAPEQALALDFDPIGSGNIARANRENGWRTLLKKPPVSPTRFRVPKKIKHLPVPSGAEQLLQGDGLAEKEDFVL